MAKPIKTIYVPDSIPTDYTYLVPSTNGEYYDLYNTKYVAPYQTVKFYRFYNDMDDDMYQNYDTTNNSNVQRSIGSEIRVNLSNDYIYRRDFKDIVLTSFIYIICIVAIVNLVTSIVKKGGVLNGIF